MMTANAAKHYLNRYGVLSGQEIVISTNNDSVYSTANELTKAGSKVHIIDARDTISQDIVESAKLNGIEMRLGTVPFNINGRKKIDSLDVAEYDGQKYNKVNQIKCDLVLVSGGWSPAVHLLSHRGTRPIWDPVNLCFLPNEIQEPITVTGSASGCLLYTSPSPRD